MPFCISCGKEIEKDHRFCENCGAPVAYAGSPAAPPPPQPPAPLHHPPPLEELPLQQPLPPEPQPSPSEADEAPAHPQPPASPEPGVAVPAQPAPKQKNTMIIIIAVAALIVIAAFWFAVLPKMGNPADSGTILPGLGAPPGTTASVTPAPAETILLPTTVPTPTPDPFPDAFSLKEWFTYNEGNYASKATVYRYWINGTYQWHNDADNRYYTQRPKAGNKYLLVYVTIVNLGTSAYPYPKSNMIFVHYGGNIYSVDSSHYIPDKAGNRKATPVEIDEIQQQSDFFNYEFVEDYGYSHGTTSDFIYPGQSNAIDGYLIYEVPETLTPDATNVEIVFDGEDRAVWKLA